MMYVVLLCSGSLWGRVEEPCLWSSRQLGEHSPSVLLRSLVYLNTKYFGLRTVEQHMRLSFGNVYGPSTSKPHDHDTTVCICIPSISPDQHGRFHCSQITPAWDHKVPVNRLVTVCHFIARYRDPSPFAASLSYMRSSLLRFSWTFWAKVFFYKSF